MKKIRRRILSSLLTAAMLLSMSSGAFAAEMAGESNSLTVADIESIQAYTDETMYGTGVVEVDVTYKDGLDVSGVTVDDYILEDRGSLSPDFGAVEIEDVSVNGQTVTLYISGDTAATESNKLVYSGADKEGSRQRNAFGIYCTGAWYRDAEGVIHYGSGDEAAGYEANTTGMGYQARASLELKLRHAGEAAEDAACLADDKGQYDADGLWEETIDRQFGEDGFQSLYDLKIPSTAAEADDGTEDPYVRGYYYIPDNYDPADGIVFTLQGQGISYWKLPDGTDDDGTGIMYDSATTSWANTGAIVVNIHDRSSAGRGAYWDIYDFVADDVAVMKYFIEEYEVTGNIVLQGNSRGTMASALVIKALAGQAYNPKNQAMGATEEETYTLDKSVYDFEIDAYICQNGTFGYSYDEEDWAAVAATGLKVWAFDGEQDSNNIDAIATYTQLMTEKYDADWAKENVRLTGLTSDLFYPWGESDHSATRINGWYFDGAAYYGPDLYIDEDGEIAYNEKLSDGDTYTLECRGSAATSNKVGYEYTVYDELFHDWALSETDPGGAAVIPTIDDIESIQAFTTPNFYGQRLYKIEVTFKNGTDMTAAADADLYGVWDRAFANGEFEQGTVKDAEVDGNTVILTFDQGPANNKPFGMLCTASWAIAEVFDGAGSSTGTYEVKAGMSGKPYNYFTRQELDLILDIGEEVSMETGVSLTDGYGNYDADGVWLESVHEVYDDYEIVYVDAATDIYAEDEKDYYTQFGGKVPVHYMVPENYTGDEALPLVIYVTGNGTSYWEGIDEYGNLASSNLGTNITYDNATAAWFELGDVIVASPDVHSNNNTAAGTEVANAIKWFQANYNIGKVILVGNSNGTGILSQTMRDFPELVDVFVNNNGWIGNGPLQNMETSKWTEEQIQGIAEEGVAIWVIQGETDPLANPIRGIESYTALLPYYEAAGWSDEWIADNLRISAFKHYKFTEWGVNDHSCVKMSSWNYITEPYLDVYEGEEPLAVGESYYMVDAKNETVQNFEYVTYAESISDWALNVAGGEDNYPVADLDDITALEIDWSQASQLPVTGYFTKTISEGRTVKVYIAEEASIRSYFTVVAVPDGVDTLEFLSENGWLELADEKGEGLFVLEPGADGWGTPEEEAEYLNTAISFLKSGKNANGVGVFSTFGEFYLVGYGDSCAILEQWAAQNPIFVISQVYVDGKTSDADALAALGAETYDEKNTGGYPAIPEFEATLDKAGMTQIARKDVPVPTWFAGGYAADSASVSYWKTANDCVEAAVDGVYYQAKDSDALQTAYANSMLAEDAQYGISQVKVSEKAEVSAEDIYSFLSIWTRYDNTFAYSNALAYRLDYTAARVGAQQDAKNGKADATYTGTDYEGKEQPVEILGQASTVIDGHGTVEVGVFSFSDNSGDGKNDPREYLLYVPEGYEGQSLPVLFVYPGNTQTDGIFFDCTQWYQIADSEGIVLIFVNETYSGPVAITHKDAIYYQTAMMTVLKNDTDGKFNNVKLDFERVYGTGQSLGSMTTQGFARSNPEFFAAVAATSGVMDMGYPDSNEPIPVYLVTGQSDLAFLVPDLAGAESLTDWANYFLKTNGLKTEVDADAEDYGADEHQFLADRYDVYSWENKQGINLVQWSQTLLRSHNCYPGEMIYLWNYLKHFSMDEDGDRYYSASAFEKNDAVEIKFSTSSSSSGGGSSSGGSSSGGSSSGGSSTTETDQPKADMPFTDVKENDWFYEAVEQAYADGIMAGVDEDTFAPDVALSRGMIAQIIYSMEGKPDCDEKIDFTDVAKGQWYTDAVRWTVANGIFAGYSDGTFGPNDTLTREQLAVILRGYAEYKGIDTKASADLTDFADEAEVSGWAYKGMEWACGAGLISGSTGGKLLPTAGATRAQAAVVLQQFSKLADK